jgi:hypothetical protein
LWRVLAAVFCPRREPVKVDAPGSGHWYELNVWGVVLAVIATSIVLYTVTIHSVKARRDEEGRSPMSPGQYVPVYVIKRSK